MSKDERNKLRYSITEGDSGGDEQVLGSYRLDEILTENEASIAAEIRSHAGEASFTIAGFTSIYYRFDLVVED